MCLVEIVLQQGFSSDVSRQRIEHMTILSQKARMSTYVKWASLLLITSANCWQASPSEFREGVEAEVRAVVKVRNGFYTDLTMFKRHNDSIRFQTMPPWQWQKLD